MDSDVIRTINGLPLRELKRIDCAFEGDWSGSVRTVWSCDDPAVNLPGPAWVSDRFLPSLELMFDTTWFGIRCYTEQGGTYGLDVERATAIIDHVLRARASVLAQQQS